MAYTIKNLRLEIAGFNLAMLHEMSNEFIIEQGRNGYQATDRYSVKADGQVRCEAMIGGGTSKEVAGYTRDFYHGVKSNTITTRQQCKRLLELNGFNLEGDFHQVSTHELCDLLVKMAKITKYRKPSYANGSTARYFFNHLVNRVQINANTGA